MFLPVTSTLKLVVNYPPEVEIHVQGDRAPGRKGERETGMYYKEHCAKYRTREWADRKAIEHADSGTTRTPATKKHMVPGSLVT
jgi:hypothetical protein